MSVAGAADEPGITVLGTGEVLAKPDLLEIDVRASAEAELTGDAVVKYDDTLRRIRGAFAKLQMKELTVDERELNIASGAAVTGGLAAVMVGQNTAPAKANFHITRSLRLAVRQIDKRPEADVIATISKLLDAAKDAGATVGKEDGSAALLQMMGRTGGPSSVVHFVVEHPEELREKAYQKAFDEATARATRLAKLAHARLGRAVSIEEVAATVAKEAGIQERMVSAVYGLETGGSDDTRLSSDKLIDIPVRVTLRVRFAIEGAAPEKGSP
ncbi:MAG TPA: SIMPL domain-containing protein [Pirellulales bacterium]|nr:SIMPL domain-containing protein [Pirellulales bacterium]